MQRFGIFLCIMLLLIASGCSQQDVLEIEEDVQQVEEGALKIEDEGPVWVKTEILNCDANGNTELHATFEYDDACNFRRNEYNAAGELISYMLVTQSEDGRETVRTNYLPDGTELKVVTETMREGGKPLSRIYTSSNHEHYTTWKWNKAGTKADIFQAWAENTKPNKIGTVEYDDQNRIIRETNANGDIGAIYIYEEQKDTTWSYFPNGSRYVMVRYYDEQNRLTEVYSYMVNHDGDYTDDDLVNYTKQTYKEDGHSLTAEYWTKDLATGDKLTGTTEITYQPLNDVV